MRRKQIFISFGVLSVLVLVIVLVIFGLPALWQLLVSMHGGG